MNEEADEDEIDKDREGQHEKANADLPVVNLPQSRHEKTEHSRDARILEWLSDAHGRRNGLCSVCGHVILLRLEALQEFAAVFALDCLSKDVLSAEGTRPRLSCGCLVWLCYPVVTLETRTALIGNSSSMVATCGIGGACKNFLATLAGSSL